MKGLYASFFSRKLRRSTDDVPRDTFGKSSTVKDPKNLIYSDFGEVIMGTKELSEVRKPDAPEPSKSRSVLRQTDYSSSHDINQRSIADDFTAPISDYYANHENDIAAMEEGLRYDDIVSQPKENSSFSHELGYKEDIDLASVYSGITLESYLSSKTKLKPKSSQKSKKTTKSPQQSSLVSGASVASPSMNVSVDKANSGELIVMEEGLSEKVKDAPSHRGCAVASPHKSPRRGIAESYMQHRSPSVSPMKGNHTNDVQPFSDNDNTSQSKRLRRPLPHKAENKSMPSAQTVRHDEMELKTLNNTVRSRPNSALRPRSASRGCAVYTGDKDEESEEMRMIQSMDSKSKIKPSPSEALSNTRTANTPNIDNNIVTVSKNRIKTEIIEEPDMESINSHSKPVLSNHSSILNTNLNNTAIYKTSRGMSERKQGDQEDDEMESKTLNNTVRSRPNSALRPRSASRGCAVYTGDKDEETEEMRYISAQEISSKHKPPSVESTVSSVNTSARSTSKSVAPLALNLRIITGQENESPSSSRSKSPDSLVQQIGMKIKSKLSPKSFSQPVSPNRRINAVHISVEDDTSLDDLSVVKIKQKRSPKSSSVSPPLSARDSESNSKLNHTDISHSAVVCASSCESEWGYEEKKSGSPIAKLVTTNKN